MMMQTARLAFLGLTFSAMVACAGVPPAATPALPNASLSFSAARPSNSTGQRLFVAYHAKPNDWIGSYTTGSSPSPLVQMTDNVSKPYALYADARGIVYSAQKGFAEYDAVTGKFLRLAIGGRPSPAPVVAPDGTIFWGLYDFPYGKMYVIPPRHKKYAYVRSIGGPQNIALASPHSIWLYAASFLGENEYDTTLHKIRHTGVNEIFAVNGTSIYTVQGSTVFVFSTKDLQRSKRYFDVKGSAVKFAFDAAHNVYVTCINGDDTGGVLAEYKAGTSKLVRSISLGTAVPYDSAVDASGYVYVADTLADEVVIYPPGSNQRSGSIANGSEPTLVTVSPQ